MSDETHRAALQPGHLVQWYEVRRILGQGGFGITYLAHDRNLAQDVAIKEYLPLELAVRDRDHTVQPVSGGQGEQYRWGLERFIDEARTLAQFKHPNIVRVLSVFEANNTAYMVMEYEHGDSLGSRLKGRGTLDETELLGVVLPLLGGLEQVHAAGFIHRDIKPPNIFLREDGSPVLLDFGSARQSTGQQTRALTALVSPGYAPFEQYHSGSEEQGPWTDIYGLAATMYRAIAGTPPVDAVDRSRSLIDSNRDYLVTAAEIGKGVYSERLLRAIDHGLAFRPRERPRSIAEWRADFGIEDHLETVRRVEALEEAPTVPAERGAGPPTGRSGGAAPPTGRPAATQPAPAAEKRGSRAIVALGLAAALIAGAGVWWLQRQAGEGSGATPPEPAAAGQPPGAVTSPPASVAADVPPAIGTVASDAQSAAETAASAQGAASGSGATEATVGPTEPAAPPRPEIARHLDRAAAQRAAGKLLAPAGDNALASYRAVLELDPGNDAAARGVRGIQTELLAAADAAIDAGDLASARSKIGYAEVVDADSAQLGITRIRLRDAERRAAAEKERQAAAAREREAAAERERLAAEERQREVEERERQAAAEREQQAAAERERQAALERERRAAAERERLVALEREREAAAERERQAAAERERQAAAARERETAAERERLAAVAAKREVELSQCRAEGGRVPAEPPRAGGGALYFAAIAIGDDYGWGEAYGFENQAEAESFALANCRKNVANCAMEVWTNDCIAMARGVDGAAGWAWGASVRDAARKALEICEGHDPCCRVTRSYCADEVAR